MGREVRRVPADWVHPRYEHGHPDVNSTMMYLVGRHISKFETPYEEALADWEAEKALFEQGLQKSYKPGLPPGSYEPLSEFAKDTTFDEWHGEQPNPEHHMPNWPEEERTHYMMYETTSEGSPISPAFDTPEKLARWLADNNASANGGQTASYEAWLKIANGGWAPSMIMTGGQILSGVEGVHQMDLNREA